MDNKSWPQKLNLYTLNLFIIDTTVMTTSMKQHFLFEKSIGVWKGQSLFVKKKVAKVVHSDKFLILITGFK